MSFPHLTYMSQTYLESGEKSQSCVLIIQINQIIILNGPKIVANFQVHLKYLIIETYNAAPIHLGSN